MSFKFSIYNIYLRHSEKKIFAFENWPTPGTKSGVFRQTKLSKTFFYKGKKLHLVHLNAPTKLIKYYNLFQNKAHIKVVLKESKFKKNICPSRSKLNL